jgi:RNA-binding protein
MDGFQKKYLKGLAHGMKPTVFIGQKGLQASVFDAIDAALDAHELIKIKFLDFKEKAVKGQLTGTVAEKTGAVLVGDIGHTAIFYRQQKDPKKRKIQLPERPNIGRHS